MDIGSINNNLINNTVENAKNSKSTGDFESRLKKAMDEKDEKELRKVCKDFESIMVSMMYKTMKATIPKSDLIKEDAGRDVFQSLLDEKLIEESTKQRGVGLADMLYKQLSRGMDKMYKPASKGVIPTVE